jgi:hypothetical protein
MLTVVCCYNSFQEDTNGEFKWRGSDVEEGTPSLDAATGGDYGGALRFQRRIWRSANHSWQAVHSRKSKDCRCPNRAMGQGESKSRETERCHDAEKTGAFGGGAEKDCRGTACALGESESGEKRLIPTERY